MDYNLNTALKFLKEDATSNKLLMWLKGVGVDSPPLFELPEKQLQLCHTVDAKGDDHVVLSGAEMIEGGVSFPVNELRNELSVRAAVGAVLFDSNHALQLQRELEKPAFSTYYADNFNVELIPPAKEGGADRLRITHELGFLPEEGVTVTRGRFVESLEHSIKKKQREGRRQVASNQWNIGLN